MTNFIQPSSSIRVCPNCEEVIKRSSRACPHCGYQISGSTGSTATSGSSKNSTLAGAFELVLPGLGIIYAGRAVLGIAIFVLTAIAGLGGLFFYENLLSQAIEATGDCQTVGFGGYECATGLVGGNLPDFSTANTFLDIWILLLVSWLIVRIFWAVRAARA